jgi:hypothetical protein
MNKRVEAINAELAKMGMILSEGRGSHRNGAFKKVFHLRSLGSYSVQGSDGEYNDCSFYGTSFALNSIKELSMAKVEEAVLAHAGKPLAEVASEVAKKVAVQEAERAVRMAKYEAEEAKRKAERDNALKPIEDSVEYERRYLEMIQRVADNDGDKLHWYNRNECRNSLVSDRYRQDFLRLVKDEQVLRMADDLIRCKAPTTLLADYEMMLGINREANRRGIQGGSIGGVSSALRYLVGVNE